jgi:hypothetical protein
MGSGPTEAKQTQQTQTEQSGTSSTAPPEYLQPFLKQAVEGITPYLTKFGESGAPSLFAGNYTATPSDDTGYALEMMRNYAKTGGQGGGTTGAYNTNLTNATLQGDYLNLDKNPYFQSALEASLRPATENFTNNVIPGLRSTFAGAGRPGAGLEGAALQDATTNFSRAATDAGAKVGAQMYGDERNRQLSTQSMLPSFQGMDINRMGLIEKAGASTDALNQKLLDEQVQRYNYAQTGGLDFLTGLAQRLQAAYPGGFTQGSSKGTSSGTSTGTPSSNPGAETASTIMAGVGTAASIASMFV